jgi:peptide subunit release factor RF-3
MAHLTAVDSAVTVPDAIKGIEEHPQTLPRGAAINLLG